MPVPATTGTLKERIQDLNIGDYIQLHKPTAASEEFEYGTGNKPEIPITGVVSENEHTGYFYAIKVDKGLLISDRVLFHSVSWDSLNNSKLIQGVLTRISDYSVILRSLTGGVAYADENGNSSNTPRGLGGWPTNNEWDKYIVNFPEDLVQSGKTSADVFNVESITFCQDAPKIGLPHPNTVGLIANNIHRTWRGKQATVNDLKTLGFVDARNKYANTGFRPVFEYLEV